MKKLTDKAKFILKGTHLLKWMPKETIQAIEHAVFNGWQMLRLTFRILKVTEKDVTIGITQSNMPEAKYYSQKELIKAAHETLDQFFTGKRIVVHASPYQESPAMKVDPTWIKKKMEQHGVKLKDMASETGLNNTQLSALISGGKPLSDAMKAMFYFYFSSKEK